MAESPEHWDREANNWIAWARTAGDDEYWRYREQRLRPRTRAGVATLEIGCGEGRVSRELGARGHRVTAVDVAPTLLEAARDADPDGESCSPTRRASVRRSLVDLVVAHNSLMDVDDLGGSVHEAARVLGAGGRFRVCVTQGAADRLAGHRFPCSRGRPLESSTVTTRPITAAIASDGVHLVVPAAKPD